jgi:hypothetical protein
MPHVVCWVIPSPLSKGLLYDLKAVNPAPVPTSSSYRVTLASPMPCTAPSAHLCVFLCLQGAEVLLSDAYVVNPASVAMSHEQASHAQPRVRLNECRVLRACCMM